MCLCCSKEPSHCFGSEIKQIIFSYALISGGLCGYSKEQKTVKNDTFVRPDIALTNVPCRYAKVQVNFTSFLDESINSTVNGLKSHKRDLTTELQASKKFLDWLQSLKQFFINVSYHIILVASLTLMALLEPSELDWLHVYYMTH